jgi:lysyl-tRNA synthetase class 2
MSIPLNWQPTASIETLRQRAHLLSQIRAFFTARDVLEVETPMLCHATLPDAHIDPFYSDYHGPDPRRLYLHTSPEAAMKRLLAAGSGAIFQIAKVFRDNEAGRLHNPEFTLLEWYRPDFSYDDLMDEIAELICLTLHLPTAKRLSYSHVFQHYIGFNPLDIALSDLQAKVAEVVPYVGDMERLDRDICLQLLMSELIEPKLGWDCPVFIYDYPASQASLARCKPDNLAVAERFELYINGVELANGFRELTDVVEQRARFEAELEQRKQQNILPIPIDERFLAALKQGMPETSGVALGIDRLLMLKLNAKHIKEVVSFDVTQS